MLSNPSTPNSDGMAALKVSDGRRVAGVIFDWDGVLLDSLGASFDVYNKIFQELGTKELTKDEFLQLQSPNWYEFYSRVGIPAGRWKYADDQWLRLYGEERPTLYPDAVGCVAELKASGFRLALVSNGSEVRVERELGRFGLASAFESVLCGRRKEELKPSPAMIERTLAAMGLGPKDVVYVGDAPADVQASRNAGVTSVAIARNRILEGRLRAEKPDYVFGELGGVVELLVNKMVAGHRGGSDVAARLRPQGGQSLGHV